ncbi:tRNA (uridine(54)-C5)-methyltransferase TrmA [Campylobacter sp. faydin G-105]|uniref:tRNA (uridine(54)-C5)-methyltransferase TrmA n=1 Tax=Campylobacter anatolicus TaxID=2829105 RepID=UPI001B9081EF|nr:tRNA (uridine(54)-C5)-methyltransferase TrmA [Campylobacter anatolicus]MBR8462951.1 tRNA (uridine(54)-C5)-methyltransferase TrmA [Campylobacter anatolicus]
MQCSHFSECGSCVLSESYEKQIEFKRTLIADKFSKFYGGEIEIFASEPRGYRNRAEFGIWHDGDEISYTMRGINTKFIKISECPKVCKTIADVMWRLLYELGANKTLKYRLFGVEFIASSNLVVAILLYHKSVVGLEEDIKDISERLNLKIIARSHGVKLQSDERELTDKFNIEKLSYQMRYGDSAFIQPNKGVNKQMIAWVRSCIDDDTKYRGDLLEMYCGHGNFTLPLSFKFKNVLATEISKSSISYALKNCEINGVQNIKFVRLSSEELMAAYAGERKFRRLNNISLSDYNFTHILVDPPRAGLDMSVINFIKNYPNIIYISCNPKTLYDNLKEITQTHKVTNFAVFDQFAHTHHIECGVLLKAKNAR